MATDELLNSSQFGENLMNRNKLFDEADTFFACKAVKCLFFHRLTLLLSDEELRVTTDIELLKASHLGEDICRRHVQDSLVREIKTCNLVQTIHSLLLLGVEFHGPLASSIRQLGINNLEFVHRHGNHAKVTASFDDGVAIEPKGFQVWQRHKDFCNVVWVFDFIAKQANLFSGFWPCGHVLQSCDAEIVKVEVHSTLVDTLQEGLLHSLGS